MHYTPSNKINGLNKDKLEGANVNICAPIIRTSSLFGKNARCVQWHSCIKVKDAYFMPSQTPTTMMVHWEGFADYKVKKA